MKKENNPLEISSFIEGLNVPTDDKFKMHPSLEKGHQPYEMYLEKRNELLDNIYKSVPLNIVKEAYKYYIVDLNLNLGYDLFVQSAFCSGPTHSGKTVYLVSQYIMALIIAASYPRNTKKIVYIEYSALIRMYKSTISSNVLKESALFELYAKADVLFIDDLFASGMDSEYALKVLYEIIEYRHLHYLPTLVTTNLTKDEILLINNGERFYRRLVEHAEILAFNIK